MARRNKFKKTKEFHWLASGNDEHPNNIIKYIQY